MSQSAPKEYLQVILSDGKLDKSSEPSLSEQDLKHIYRSMLTTRLFDIKSMNLQRQGRIGFYVPCSGQEAAQIGSAFALRNSDWTLPTYRDMGVAILRGVPVRTLFDHLMGNAKDLMRGRQMPNHWGFKSANYVSIASTIAAHLPVATGVAMAMKMKNEDNVVMAYHGDGATSAGDFHSAYNFAGVYKAPIVFICENNGWAISLPASKQTASGTFAEKALAYGFPGVRVDGNDALAVYKAAREAVERARKGQGPTMIECLTYRMGPHSTSDDPNRYRTREEMEAWKRKDPVERFRSYLERKGYWSKDFEEDLRAKIDAEINTAVKEEAEVPPPELSTMFTDVYSTMPQLLREELREEEEFSESSSTNA
ncbi:MAG TPA: pyruvate dehydrogenase (acetyl-transferring) E1 component subunit alpha [Nitrososphaerales archaeon]|nr:pyruvate dehydrogenase (acetyl-transferring) E1 component subunit alpha [Nitrososphaerales archaeon]